MTRKREEKQDPAIPPELLPNPKSGEDQSNFGSYRNFKMTAGLAAIVLVLVALLVVFWSRNSTTVTREGKYTIAIVFGSVAVFCLLFAYLQRHQSGLASSSAVEDAGGQNFRTGELWELLSASEREALLAEVLQRVKGAASTKFPDDVRALIEQCARDTSYNIVCDAISRRLRKFAQDLVSRSNANLCLGITITIAGVILLAYIIFSSTIDPDPKTSVLLAYFLPRFSLVVLIEVFAYFFLSLYKKDLSEVKFCQNELTNIESWHLALQVALAQGSSAVKDKFILKLVSTDRNFSSGNVRRGRANPRPEVIKALQDIAGMIRTLGPRDGGKP